MNLTGETMENNLYDMLQAQKRATQRKELTTQFKHLNIDVDLLMSVRK